MSKEVPKSNTAGWGCLTLLLMFGFCMTFLMLFVGGGWHWPTLFFGGLVAVVVRQMRIEKAKTSGH